jgi:hypothetical protein
MQWWQELFHPSLWDWGDAATWFTGIATAGTLWVGFTVLWFDRRREERSQAAKIAIFSQSFSETEEDDWNLRIRVWNHSDRPIIHTILYGTDPMKGAMLLAVKDRLLDLDPVILPGESAELELRDMNEPTYDGLHVVFSDASGVDWKYKVGTRQLSKAKRRTVEIGEGETKRKVRLPKLD